MLFRLLYLLLLVLVLSLRIDVLGFGGFFILSLCGTFIIRLVKTEDKIEYFFTRGISMIMWPQRILLSWVYRMIIGNFWFIGLFRVRLWFGMSRGLLFTFRSQTGCFLHEFCVWNTCSVVRIAVFSHLLDFKFVIASTINFGLLSLFFIHFIFIIDLKYYN